MVDRWTLYIRTVNCKLSYRTVSVALSDLFFVETQPQSGDMLASAEAAKLYCTYRYSAYSTVHPFRD